MADIAKGIGAAMQAVGEGVANWQEQEAKIQQNQALLKQRRLEFEAEKEKRDQELKILKFGQAATIMQSYGTMAEKYGEKSARNFLEKNRATVQDYFDVDSLSVDPKAAAQQIRDYSRLMGKKARGEDFSDDELELLTTLDGIMSEKGRKSANELAATQRQAQLDKEIGPIGLGGKKISPAAARTLPEKSPEGTQFNVTQGGLELGEKKYAPRTTSTGWDQQMGKDLAKDQATALKMLPQNKFRIQRLNASMKLIDKVISGPLAGQDIFFYLQKLGPKSKEAQTLGWLLKAENVNLIMDFAKAAGVRAIDTEKERQGLLEAIQNKKMDADVFKRAVINTKIALQAAEIRTRQVQQYMAATKAEHPGNFIPPIDQTDVYVNPKTYEPVFVQQGEKAPEGLISYEDMLVGGVGESKGGKITDSSLDDLDAKYGKK